MRGKLFVICALTTLVGCSHYKGGSGAGTDYAMEYGAGFGATTVVPRPGSSGGSNVAVPFPRQFSTGDKEQGVPQLQIDASKNWSRDILPVGPDLIHEGNGVLRL